MTPHNIPKGDFVMFFDMALVWPVILALCAFVLFVKASLLMRALIVTRQAAWKYLLVLLPLIVSAWSFVVATNSLYVYSDTLRSFVSDIHFGPSLYYYLKATMLQAANESIIQLLVILLVFWFTLFIERRAIPRLERTPAWVLARETLLRV
jgi:hypothetical protein